ncbi:MAG: type III-B CRISPR module RAMP protein Cmr6 [Ruminococcus sp.]|nr:type III-B CRISPR module RAMP protein Cmr6 [Ruminococcus sp.]
MDNLNLLFNKEYYRFLGVNRNSENPKDTCFQTRELKINGRKETIDGTADIINREIEQTVFTGGDFRECPIPGAVTFRLKTVYPGLLIGTGAPHGVTKDVSGSSSDFSCGFYFDYVTGQPYIPGSSVKGVLRSHFKHRGKAVAEIAQGLGVTFSKSLKEIETAVFDNGVIFFDAVVCRGDRHNHIVGSDYITPHESPTKNPKPIHIIKVMPDVQFEFRFKLNPGFDESVIGAEDLKRLFTELLTLFGAGAKTNVGYGSFTSPD